MAKNRPTEEELDELRETFDYNDRDNDGRIQIDEFSAMLDELEADMSGKEIEIGFKDIDTNDDGLIDFDEFVADDVLRRACARSLEIIGEAVKNISPHFRKKAQRRRVDEDRWSQRQADSRLLRR